MAGSSKEPKTVIFYINLGGGLANIGALRYAWRGKKNSYKNIGPDLGVETGKDTDNALLFGLNDPKPAKVRIHYTKADGETGSVIRFCEPDKINKVTTGGALKDKKININGSEFKIHRVTL